MDFWFLERITPGMRAIAASVCVQAMAFALLRARLPTWVPPLTAVLLALFLYRWLDRRSFRDFGFTVGRRAAILGGAGLVLILGVAALAHTFAPAAWAMQSQATILRQAAILGAVAAMGEEFFLRGYVFRTMDRYGFPLACGLSILFTAAVQWAYTYGEPHLLLRMLETAAAGAVFAYIYYHTGSIWPGLVLHGALGALSGALDLLASPLLQAPCVFLLLAGLFILSASLLRRWERVEDYPADSDAA